MFTRSGYMSCYLILLGKVYRMYTLCKSCLLQQSIKMGLHLPLYCMATYGRAGIWWRYQMETFSALLAICAGTSPVTGEFTAQRPWRGVLMFSLMCAWINGWVYNGETGDLIRHRAHFDVTVIMHMADLSLCVLHQLVLFSFNFIGRMSP